MNPNLTALERQTERQLQYDEQRGKFIEAGFAGYPLTLAMQTYLLWRDSIKPDANETFSRRIEELEKQYLKGK